MFFWTTALFRTTQFIKKKQQHFFLLSDTQTANIGLFRGLENILIVQCRN